VETDDIGIIGTCYELRLIDTRDCLCHLKHLYKKNEKIGYKELTMDSTSLTKPFSNEGGPTLISRITCLADCDINYKR
jgi:hypothetical protein